MAYYACVKVERVMNDNGSCYCSRAFAKASKKLGLKASGSNPYTPKTSARPNGSFRRARANGKMPGRTTLHEHAADLPRWPHHYNWYRPDGSVKSKPPVSNLGRTGTFVQPIGLPVLLFDLPERTPPARHEHMQDEIISSVPASDPRPTAEFRLACRR
jgi:hypothetical protein